MTIIVNHEVLNLPDHEQISIPELLAHLQLESPAFATIILNGKPVDVSTRNDIIIHTDDRVDILQYVAGG